MGGILLVKKIFYRIVIILIVILLIKLFLNPYARISRYINHNGKQLKTMCDEFLEEGGMFKDSFSHVQVDGIFGNDTKIVQFYFSGKGLVPSSTYYGFYYSPNDVPVPYANEDYPLTEKNQNKWIWNGEGDNGGVIKKIRDNWYYYEAWF